jgi:hypothetical protein
MYSFLDSSRDSVGGLTTVKGGCPAGGTDIPSCRWHRRTLCPVLIMGDQMSGPPSSSMRLKLVRTHSGKLIHDAAGLFQHAETRDEVGWKCVHGIAQECYVDETHFLR